MAHKLIISIRISCFGTILSKPSSYFQTSGGGSFHISNFHDKSRPPGPRTPLKSCAAKIHHHSSHFHNGIFFWVELCQKTVWKPWQIINFMWSTDSNYFLEITTLKMMEIKMFQKCSVIMPKMSPKSFKNDPNKSGTPKVQAVFFERVGTWENGPN